MVRDAGTEFSFGLHSTTVPLTSFAEYQLFKTSKGTGCQKTSNTVLLCMPDPVGVLLQRLIILHVHIFINRLRSYMTSRPFYCASNRPR